MNHETVFIAVEKNDDNHIYSMTFGIGRKKGLETCTLLMKGLNRCIGDSQIKNFFIQQPREALILIKL